MNRFGMSTHLFHESRLTREHLVDIAGHGFEAVEVFATRAHFDYTDAAAVDALAEWLSDTRLELHSIHAPIVDAIKDGKWVGSYSTAAGDEARRKTALDQATAALNVARTIKYKFLVVHLGIPDGQKAAGPDNQPGAARRSIEEIAEQASALGVGVAVEVMPNALSSPASLIHLLEEELENPHVGLCLDYGHAHLMGDVTDAVETISGHLLTTHVQDNGGKRDDHLVPFAGSIDWSSAIMATQKIGYEGVLMFEVDGTGNPADVLRRSVKARERLEKLFITF
jgi:sugar phosphate isomerase/epimerase